MCGIIGCVLKEGNCWGNLSEGLKRLEYRGYDSVGVGVLKDGKISVIKKKGGADSLSPYSLSGTTGIGHTRWATHGAPSDINAHPHVFGKFALVHNGIIENFASLKLQLIEQGEIFYSDTDTEVIVKLISRAYTGDFLRAVKDGVSKLCGSFAIAVLCSDFPDTIICAKNKSPLFAAKSEKGVFICSDIPAVSAFCPDICPASDGEFICLTGQRIVFYDCYLKSIEKSFIKIDGAISIKEKNNFSSYMEEEIFDIPRALSDTYASLNDTDFTVCAQKLAFAKRVFCVACGTAYHATLAFSLLAEKYLKIPIIAERASEFRYKSKIIEKGDVLIAVSQSGETADTAEAVKLAKSVGAYVIAVTNIRHSTIASLADTNIQMRAGAEIAVAATKSYNCQLLCLYSLVANAFLKKTGAYPDFYYKLPSLSLLAKQSFNCFLKMEELSSILKSRNACYFLGRNADFITSVEGALKLKEIAYIFSEGYPAGELKHGTLALIEKNFPVIAVATQKNLVKKTENAIAEVVARGGFVALISPFSDYLEESLAQFKCKIPETHEDLAGCVSIIPLQYLALKTCLSRSFNPDKPRNLAKSVTVE